MKRVFAALQLLQMMRQPNRYKGRGNRAKAHRPERGDETAKKCTKQPAKEKLSLAQHGEGAPRLLHHQPISPRHRLAKLADPGRAQPKQPGQGGSRQAKRVPGRRLRSMSQNFLAQTVSSAM